MSHLAIRHAAVLSALLACAGACSSSSAHRDDVTPPAPSAPAPAIASAAPVDRTPTDVLADVPAVAPPLSERGAAALKESREHFYDVDDRLGADPPPRGTYVEDTFFVLTHDRGAAFDAALEQTRMMVDAMWHGPMSHRLEQAVEIWVFSTHAGMAADVHKYAKGARADGFGVYWPATHEIDFTTEAAGIGTLRHELMHPLIEQDFPTAPVWFAEGLASLYEVVDPPTPDVPHVLRPRAHFRLKRLRTALQSPATAGAVRMDTLFGLSDDDFRKDESMNYARAREMLRWLDGKGQLWSWYHRWRDDVAADPTGDKAFQAATGQTPAQANDAWVAWVQSPDALR